MGKRTVVAVEFAERGYSARALWYSPADADGTNVVVAVNRDVPAGLVTAGSAGYAVTLNQGIGRKELRAARQRACEDCARHLIGQVRRRDHPQP